MSKIATVQNYYWVGENFATYCLLQSGSVLSFASLYVAPANPNYIVKERFWKNGILLSIQEIAAKPFYLEALQLFHEKVASFNRRMFKKYATRKKTAMCFPTKTRSPLKGYTPEMGEAVTCLRPVTAYYSGYAGNPHCIFEPGDVGNVGAINVPAVYHHPENPSDLFACVDFNKPDVPTFGRFSTTRWRCAMYYHHMIRLSQYPQKDHHCYELCADGETKPVQMAR